MAMSRGYHIAVGLPMGQVLVGGGCNAATCLPWAEIFSSDGLPADDIEALGGKSAAVLDRLFGVAQKINGMAAADIEALEKN